jgi:hypothetical protein
LVTAAPEAVQRNYARYGAEGLKGDATAAAKPYISETAP